jgi:hypothetical protein
MLKTFLSPLVKSYAPNAIRHAATGIGSALATYGLTTADEATAVSGAVAVLLGVAWSVIEKKGLLNKLFA